MNEPEVSTKAAYKIQEVARLFSISRSQAYRLVDLQIIDSVKLGRSRLVTSEQLAKFRARLNNCESIDVIR